MPCPSERPAGSVELRLVRIPTAPAGPGPLRCLNCGETLQFHQPESDLPDRMLGTCDECHQWHLIDFVPGKPEAVVAPLPAGDQVRERAGSG
jgi:hypothetical protein